MGCVAGSEAKMGIRLQSPSFDRRGREAIAPFLRDRHPGWGVGGEKGRQPRGKRRRIRGCSKNYSPFIAFDKHLFAAFWISIF